MPDLRLTSTLATILVAALLAGGCGDDTASIPATTSDAKPRVASTPTNDAALTKELDDALAPLVDAGCAYGTFAEEAADHVDPDELSWKTFPPASGRHVDKWADFGTYDEPVNDGYLVHNLEHGGVVAWIGDGVTEDQRTAIEGLLDDEEKWVVAPRADLDGLAVHAWAKGLSCSGKDVAGIAPKSLATALDAWYDAVNSTGSDAEKDVPAYGGGLDEPKPSRDISADPPF